MYVVSVICSRMDYGIAALPTVLTAYGRCRQRHKEGQTGKKEGGKKEEGEKRDNGTKRAGGKI